jgi:hypothetical protein
MVRSFLFLFLLCFQGLFSSVPEIDVSLGDSGAIEGRPISLHVIVSRDRNAELDFDSFKLDNQSIEAQFSHNQTHSSIRIINGVRESKDLLISSFTVDLPEKSKGNYILSPIFAKIDGVYHSSPKLTYQVREVTKDANLTIEAFVKGSGNLFPGQVVTVGYTVLMEKKLEHIEWSSQDFPLFKLESFRALGEVKVEESINGPYLVKIFFQKMQAVKPGNYSVPGAFISGTEFRQDFFGRRSYGTKIAAKSNTLDFSVLPFPDENRPEGFNGVIGNFLVKAELVGNNELLLGDKLILKIEVFGDENFSDVKLPEFHRDPRFKELFRFNDFLADSQERDNKKVFIIEMRPVHKNVDKIPSVDFVFFDPIAQKYNTVSTQEIPIKVNSLSGSLEQEEKNRVLEEEEPLVARVEPLSNRIEIFGNLALIRKVKEDYSLSYETSLRILFLFLFLYFLQIFVLQLWKTRLGNKKGKADDSLKEALSHDNDFTLFFALMEKVLVLRLFEKGHIATDEISIMDLGNTEVQKEIKKFFGKVDVLRYSGKTFELDKLLVEEVKKLYRSIK